MSSVAVKQLQLAPLGAGDLIDRTVRLYRRHFMALIRASAPPVFVGAVGAVMWSVGVRSIALTESDERLVLYVLLAAAGVFVRFVGLLAQLIVLGGASRNLVMHLLWGEPVTARLIYRSVRSRFWGLLGAALAMCAYLLLTAGLALVAWYVALIIFIVGVALLFAGAGPPSWVVVAASVLFTLGTALLALWLFFFTAGRAAYVPQVMMVEGRGVLDSIGRSAGLARGNVRRLMAMFLFTLVGGYSAFSLLFVPLGWAAYLSGVNPFTMDASRLPVWYTVGAEVALQLSVILLAPVWMMGLSLLYVDERVRHEGYDIELLAAQRLGEIPALPSGVNTPLSPAIAAAAPPPPPRAHEAARPGSVLGLNDRA
ncbi:MAG TPA: hypothetical protein VG148_11340 [Pyrinomonadaceae bacterium]|nr:hypothetical protein [Pyrinomonadaceae bacterium]